VLSVWDALSDERSGLTPVCHCQQYLVYCQKFNIIYIVHVTCFMYMQYIHISAKSQSHDRQSVSQSVLVSGTHPGPATNFFSSLFDYFRQLRVCWCGAPSLTRSRVCIFQFLPGIASTDFLTSEPHGTHEHILLSLILRLPQPGGPGSCIYFPRNRVAQLEPGHWVLSLPNQSQSHITTDNQSASSSWCQTPIWDPRPIFLSLWDFF
jgi:hypothetical protein